MVRNLQRRASKIIVKFVLMGTQVLGRAFMEAYRQAAANAGKNAGQAAAASTSGSGKTASAAINELTRKTGISFEEASKILNVERDTAPEIVLKNYEHLFKVNDPKSGGSLYLQSKVYRAKERVDMELGTSQPKPPQQ